MKHLLRVTFDGMARRAGKTPPIVGNTDLVEAGVVELMELAQKGWTVVRP